MKRLFVSIMIVSTFFIFTMPVYGAADDITGHPLEKEMRQAVDRDVLKGYGKGRFGPNDKVTRAQFATFLARALSLPAGEASFSDVPSSHIHAEDIGKAFAAELITGYPGNEFRPEEYITREQMAVMIDRALAYEEVERTGGKLAFTDEASIHPMYKEAIANNVAHGIILGEPDGDKYRFKPKADATRAHAAAFIMRMLYVTEPFLVGTVDGSGNLQLQSGSYQTFAEASSQNADVVTKAGKILKMKSGIVAASPLESVTIIYGADKRSQQTYVMPGAELDYVQSDEEWIEVKYADRTGFVKQHDALLIPTQMQKGKSYYTSEHGMLYHYIFNPLTNQMAKYSYADAPSFMKENERYTSLNGRDFYNASNTRVGGGYQYFNYLPLRTKSNYTGEDLNRYIRSLDLTYQGKVVATESPLKELGDVFKEAEEKFGINALYLFSKAIHESAYGLSEIAHKRKNLFGYQAYDKDPLGNAMPFDSFEDSIMFVAEEMSKRYLSPRPIEPDERADLGINYNGAVLGNKGHGMNIRYASDPFWGQKIAGHMYRADKYLGKKDFNYYTIARTTPDRLNVRPEPNTSKKALYHYPSPSYYVALLEKIDQNGETWYKIYSDHLDYEYGYVHGNYVEPISILQ